MHLFFAMHFCFYFRFTSSSILIAPVLLRVYLCMRVCEWISLRWQSILIMSMVFVILDENRYPTSFRFHTRPRVYNKSNGSDKTNKNDGYLCSVMTIGSDAPNTRVALKKKTSYFRHYFFSICLCCAGNIHAAMIISAFCVSFLFARS